MDGLLTSGQVAAELGTSVPRVLRAARAGLDGVVRRGSRTFFTTAARDELARRWGVMPRGSGLTTEELKALAVLSRRPFGLRSARAVARLANVSPTATIRVLDRLTRSGLVERRSARVVEGHVADVGVWQVAWTSPRWREEAAAVSEVVLPEPPAPRPRTQTIPARLAHVFWNADVRRLEVDRDAALIADRIVRSDDLEALAWLATSRRPDAIEAAAHRRGTDPRRARLAHVLAVALS